MSKIVKAACALSFLLAVAACTTAPAQNSDLTPPGRKIDAKTQLECGTKRGC